MIIEGIFRKTTTRDLYEEYSTYSGTGTKKLSKGSDNYRIYCKIEKITREDNMQLKRIVLAKLHHKKDQNLSKKETNSIIMIKGYYDNITKGYKINKYPLPVFNPTELINLKYEDLIKENILTFSSKKK